MDSVNGVDYVPSSRCGAVFYLRGAGNIFQKVGLGSAARVEPQFLQMVIVLYTFTPERLFDMMSSDMQQTTTVLSIQAHVCHV